MDWLLYLMFHWFFNNPHAKLQDQSVSLTIHVTSFAGLKRQPLLRLPSPPILRTSHLRPQANQDLLHPHIPIPILGSRHFGINDLPTFGIDAVNVDFGHEANFRGRGGIGLWDGDAQLVEAAVVLCLRWYIHMWYSFISCYCIDGNDWYDNYMIWAANNKVETPCKKWKRANRNNNFEPPLWYQSHVTLLMQSSPQSLIL